MTTPAHHVHFSTTVDSTTPRVRPIHGYAPQVVLYVCDTADEPNVSLTFPDAAALRAWLDAVSFSLVELNVAALADTETVGA